MKSGRECGDEQKPRFLRGPIPVILYVTYSQNAGIRKQLQRKRLYVADTTRIADVQERKKLKRAARKKAAPKPKQTEPRGSKKKKVKKASRGVSKR